MKRLVFLLSLVLFLPASVSAAEEGLLQKLKGAAQKLLGQGASGGAAPAEGKGNLYIIHLTSGGKIESDNYTIENDRLRIEIPAGAIYLDKSMVRNIEEVAGAEQDTVQTIKVPTNPPPQERPEKTAPPPARKRVEAPIPPAEESVKDDNGHDEAWWRGQINEWKKHKADAQARFDKAQADWNRLTGLISVGGTEFTVQRYSDSRGAARVEMDRAQAEIDRADNMLNTVIPEEARKAGAPAGWVRD